MLTQILLSIALPLAMFAQKQANGPGYTFIRRASFVLLLFMASMARAEITFTETTSDLGITYVGPSWGLAWGDWNGDGYPDLWTGNHGHPGSLYVNENGLLFNDVASSVLPPAVLSGSNDTHGAAWADFDNDGDLDLIELDDAGQANSVPNHLFENQGGGQSMPDIGVEKGVGYPALRGRTPLWTDFDRDGLLDLVLTTEFRSSDQPGDFLSPTVLWQGATQFELANDLVQLGNETASTYFASTSDLTGDGVPELLLRGSPPVKISMFETNQLPFAPLSSVFSGTDVAIGDYNGDLRPDLFIVSGGLYTVLVRVSDVEVRAQLRPSVGKEIGLDLENKGDLTVHFSRGYALVGSGTTVFVGENAIPANPSAPFVLQASDPRSWGIPPHTPGVDQGIYVGLEPGTNMWTFRSSNAPLIAFALTSSIELVDAQAVGFNNSASPAVEQLLINTGSGEFTDQSAASGINVASWGIAVATADFDNDMDLDVYIVGGTAVSNRFNTLWENLGDGSFVSVVGAGGAEGTALGKGDAVALADYDLDGFIDLGITNGQAAPPFDIGPVQVYRNDGGTNHWLQIDLEGVISNRDGVGAKLFAMTDSVTQMREQNSGAHWRAQDHSRVHFGLGSNTVVDTLLVKWPSGASQTVSDIPADQIIRVLEPSDPSTLGQPTYTPGVDAGLYIWQEFAGGPYHLRVNGSIPASNYEIKILAEQPITDFSPFGMESDDSWQWDSNAITMNGFVSTGVDGMTFSVPSGRAFIAFEFDGVSNPRQLHIGASGAPIPPAGWILDADDLPQLPAFVPGSDLGLYIGKPATQNQVAARWSGDGFGAMEHRFDLEMISSQPLGSVATVDFEGCCDALTQDRRWLRAVATEAGGQDGLDVLVAAGSQLGIFVRQDDLFQSHRANGQTRDLGVPNAYQLPSSAGGPLGDVEPDGVPDDSDNCINAPTARPFPMPVATVSSIPTVMDTVTCVMAIWITPISLITPI